MFFSIGSSWNESWAEIIVERRRKWKVKIFHLHFFERKKSNGIFCFFCTKFWARLAIERFMFFLESVKNFRNIINCRCVYGLQLLCQRYPCFKLKISLSRPNMVQRYVNSTRYSRLTWLYNSRVYIISKKIKY